MSISDLRPQHPGAGASPAALLAEAVASAREAAGAFFAAQCDQDLIATVELTEQLRAVTAAVQAGAVAEADARDLAKQQLAYGSTGDWLTHTGGLRKGEGRRVVARAHALTGALADTREALAAGTVSPEQADVIVKSIEALPSGAAVRARGQQVLVEQAGSLDATDLARTGRHLVHVVDPDAEDRRLERQLAREERAAHHVRYLSITADGAGGVRLKGRGSAEDGALLKAALLPLTAPAPAVDDEHGDLVHDPRDHGARLWDALVQVAQHGLDADLPPESHGAPTRLMVTVTLDALRSGLAETAATTTTTETGLSIATIRRLACDAEVIPAVLGAHGEPLDVGRAKRLVTAAIWVALVLRDRHCAFPGCDRPPVMCHAHHIRHWIFGGETKLSNLVLLCGHHHRVIHNTPWDVRLNPDDHQPEFRPPPKPGIETQWIRQRPRRE
ncbi:HNH endonuclease signature motif containing protein [Nocardioides sp.]|uniref:HNH endonuclease signature motif containing protein n=1 Tax=Nocardioides sp. TaxID=35761 RepID=UPI002F400D7F